MKLNLIDRVHVVHGIQHHKLLHLGFSHQRVVLMMWAFALLTCLAALGVAFVRGNQVWSVLVIYSVVVFVVVRKMGFIRAEKWQGEFKAGRNLKQKRKKQIISFQTFMCHDFKTKL